MEHDETHGDIKQFQAEDIGPRDFLEVLELNYPGYPQYLKFCSKDVNDINTIRMSNSETSKKFKISMIFNQHPVSIILPMNTNPCTGCDLTRAMIPTHARTYAPLQSILEKPPRIINIPCFLLLDGPSMHDMHVVRHGLQAPCKRSPCG